LILDGELRRRMARRGREIAVGEFSVEDFVAKSLAVYREVATEARLAWP
jgi:glycosyltransferase involved in cell wall biosynthesis